MFSLLSGGILRDMSSEVGIVSYKGLGKVRRSIWLLSLSCGREGGESRDETRIPGKK